MPNNMIEKVNRKSMLIRESGRSADYISPSFGHGCLYNCTYCYMKRNKPNGLTIANNYIDILTAINNHCAFSNIDKPNQTHELFVTYDISCNEDFCLHLKYHNWKSIFDFFKNHEIAMGSLATKYVNEELLSYNPDGKIRIRFSLMPQKISDLLEPNTSSIIDRILSIDRFIKAGYDVHVNFSPVIVYDGWLDDYKELFKLVNENVVNKSIVKAEVIFLTHNIDKHYNNMRKGFSGEDLLWTPDIQESKTSQYGGNNLRYKHNLKANYIKEWTRVHDEIIPWNKIRYIF